MTTTSLVVPLDNAAVTVDGAAGTPTVGVGIVYVFGAACAAPAELTAVTRNVTTADGENALAYVYDKTFGATDCCAPVVPSLDVQSMR